MAGTFRLDCHDEVLASRMSPAEWRRVLAFRAEPRMLEGLFAYAELMPAFFAGNAILNKVVTEEWRFYTLVFALHLHATRNPADPRSGLTLGNLQRLCVAQNVASRGRAAAILGIMRLGGYVRSRRPDIDSRVKGLEPSPAFMATVESWTHTLLRIIDHIRPDEPLAPLALERPGFGPEMRRRGAETMLRGWRALAAYPEAAHFIHSDGGWMLLLPVIAESVRRGEGGLAPVTVALDAHGRRFGVSRSHLRRLLESAWSKGLLAAPPRNGAHILPTPELAAAFIACMASELGYARGWAEEAARTA
jgi:hypothetical protein